MTVIETFDISAAANANRELQAGGWTPACRLDHLIPGRGVAVLLRGDRPSEVGRSGRRIRQAALFLLPCGSLFAVDNIDPIGRAAVLSRGIVGDRGGIPVVVSPLLKQAYSLIDGRCLDDDSVTLPVYALRVENGIVAVSNEPIEYDNLDSGTA